MTFRTRGPCAVRCSRVFYPNLGFWGGVELSATIRAWNILLIIRLIYTSFGSGRLRCTRTSRI